MKKLMCLALGVSMIGAMIVVAGCGGGGGIGAMIGIGLLVIALTATGPAGAVPFAANIKAMPAGTSLTASYTAIVTPTGRTPISTDTIYIDNATKKVLSFSNLQVEASTDGQYKVEIYPKGYTSTTAPIFKYYFTKDVPSGETLSTDKDINATDTARALIYDRWAGSATMDIDQFLNQVPAASVTAVVDEIIDTMDDLAAGKYTKNFQWSSDTLTAAQNAALVTPSTATYNNENVHGWWIMDPNANNEYSAVHANNVGSLVEGSDFDAESGTYILYPSGSLLMQLFGVSETINVTATMTSMTTLTYEARNHAGALEESGSAIKVSNLAACQGTWTGQIDGESSSITIDAYGRITALSGISTAEIESGFVVSEGGKTVGYMTFIGQDTPQVRFFGTVSGSTFTGTVESSTDAGPSGNFTMTKSS